MVLISIITITYNAADTITSTMLSVAEQTCSDYEHIVADGASLDSTLELVRRNGTPGVRILSEPDKGIYDAMNKGLKLARGKYVIFLNAGDTFHSPDTLERYAHAARETYERHGYWPDVVYADTIIVDKNRRMMRPRHFSAPDRLTFDSYCKGMLVCHQAFMVRTDLVEPYDTRWKFSADYEWTLRILRKTEPEKCINLHKVAIDYLADGTTDRNHRASLIERFKIMCHYYGAASTILEHIKKCLSTR